MDSHRALTPTLQRILAVLQDGQPHPRDELRACLNDDLANIYAFRRHLSQLRKQLRLQGLEIISQRVKPSKGKPRLQFRIVRLLLPNEITIV